MSKVKSHHLCVEADDFCRNYTLKVYQNPSSQKSQVSLFIKDTLSDQKETSQFQGVNFSKQPLNKFDITVDEQTNMDKLISELALNHDNDLSEDDKNHKEIVQKLKNYILIKVEGMDDSSEGFLPGE